MIRSSDIRGFQIRFRSEGFSVEGPYKGLLADSSYVRERLNMRVKSNMYEFYI